MSLLLTLSGVPLLVYSRCLAVSSQKLACLASPPSLQLCARALCRPQLTRPAASAAFEGTLPASLTGLPLPLASTQGSDALRRKMDARLERLECNNAGDALDAGADDGDDDDYSSDDTPRSKAKKKAKAKRTAKLRVRPLYEYLLDDRAAREEARDPCGGRSSQAQGKALDGVPSQCTPLCLSC